MTSLPNLSTLQVATALALLSNRKDHSLDQLHRNRSVSSHRSCVENRFLPMDRSLRIHTTSKTRSPKTKVIENTIKKPRFISVPKKCGPVQPSSQCWKLRSQSCLSYGTRQTWPSLRQRISDLMQYMLLREQTRETRAFDMIRYGCS